MHHFPSKKVHVHTLSLSKPLETPNYCSKSLLHLQEAIVTAQRCKTRLARTCLQIILLDSTCCYRSCVFCPQESLGSSPSIISIGSLHVYSLFHGNIRLASLIVNCTSTHSIAWVIPQFINCEEDIFRPSLLLTLLVHINIMPICDHHVISHPQFSL